MSNPPRFDENNNPSLLPTVFVSRSCNPVSKQSDEWGMIEWFLQLTFRTSNITLRSLWTVSNPTILAKFTRRSMGLAAYPAVIASEDLPQTTTMRQVCDEGFPAVGGVSVAVGNLPLPGGFLTSGEVRKQGVGRRVFEYLAVRVAVGKSRILTGSGASGSASLANDATLVKELSQDYDSYWVQKHAGISSGENSNVGIENENYRSMPIIVQSAHSTASKGFLPPHTFNQTYLVRDGSQVLPMFVCRFEIDSDKPEMMALPPCANCEDRPATIWCAADNAALCIDCDRSQHETNKITQRHVRVPVNERPRPTGPCGVYPEKEAELWDATEGIALCEEAYRDHFSLRPRSNFVPIGDAYRSSLRLAMREESEFADAKVNLNTHTRAEKESLNSIERSIKHTEDAIYERVNAALEKAVSFTDKRNSALLESERDLKIKLEFLQWAQDLITPYAHVVPPTEWLQLWLTHYRLVREFLGDDNETNNAKSLLEKENALMSATSELRVESTLKIEKSRPPPRKSLHPN